MLPIRAVVEPFRGACNTMHSLLIISPGVTPGHVGLPAFLPRDSPSRKAEEPLLRSRESFGSAGKLKSRLPGRDCKKSVWCEFMVSILVGALSHFWFLYTMSLKSPRKNLCIIPRAPAGRNGTWVCSWRGTELCHEARAVWEHWHCPPLDQGFCHGLGMSRAGGGGGGAGSEARSGSSRVCLGRPESAVPREEHLPPGLLHRTATVHLIRCPCQILTCSEKETGVRTQLQCLHPSPPHILNKASCEASFYCSLQYRGFALFHFVLFCFVFKVLGQLMETGIINPEQCMTSFEHMKKSGDY